MLGDHAFSIRFALCTLALWRITHLITAEDGPWDCVARVRALFGDSVLGRMMDCFYCSSLWLAIPFALVVAEPTATRILSWLALSGAASLLERATTHTDRTPQPPPSKQP
jgi:hypothetical protein